MPHRSQNREILFTISDVGRLLRTYADQKARHFGQTRAQWAVLLRLERREGLKQSDLAEDLDIQPITLTRLVDRLCDNGLIERRPDPNDRRAKRLYLTAAARPLLDRIDQQVEELAEKVLACVDPAAVGVMLTAFGHRELIDRAAEAGVYGYLVKPFREQDVVPAIETARARHEELAAVRAEADSLSEALVARKAIEPAKGLLMEKEKLSEADAFARLRRASQVSGRPLRVIAEAVIDTFEPS